MLQNITLPRNKCMLTGLITVAVLGVGGYILHRKVLKSRLLAQAWKLSMMDYDNELSGYYDEDGDRDSDYYDGLFGDFDSGSQQAFDGE